MSLAPQRRLLAVVAHPDDETFGCGGLLARYASEGTRVSLVCATRGEAGEISDPNLATKEDLGYVREGELRAACAVLGVQDLTFLDYRDSGMAGTEDNAHPQSLYQAGKGDLTGKVVEAVRQIKPQVVLTFDANGGYGHPDHIAMHHAAVEAFHAAGDPTKFPDQLAAGLAPHQPNKLYYFVFPQSMVTAISEAMKAASIEMPDDFQEMGVPDDQVTTLVDVSGYARQKEQAARCHRTQLSTAENSDPFAWLPEPVKKRYLSREFLVRAVPPITKTGEAPEDDLFAGLA